MSIAAISDFHGSKISCYGDSNGEIKAIVRDPNNNIVGADYYKWFKGVDVIGEGPLKSTVENLDAGVYTVKIQYNSHCETESIPLAIENPEPVSAATSVSSDYHGYHISCPGDNDGSLRATVQGGTGPSYTFLWDTGTTGADLLDQPAGTYTVTVSDINGCTDVKSETLVDPPPINPSISIESDFFGQHISCHGENDGKLKVTALGGAGSIAYSWNTGATGPELNNLIAGHYTVNATDENGCSMVASISLVDPDSIKASVEILSDFHGKPISCFGAADGIIRASASGGTSSFTFIWSNGISGSDLTGVLADFYEVIATDQNGCTGKDTITIVNPESVSINIVGVSDYNGYGVSCKDANDGFIEVIGKGGTGIFTCFWLETAETTFSASELSKGTYTVRVADENGCQDTEEQEIIEPPPLTLALTDSVNISCHSGNDGQLTALAAGGVHGYEYSINNSGWQASPVFLGLAANTFTVKVEDANECTSTYTITLDEPEKLGVSFVTEPAFCADPRGKASASVTGGVGSYTYEWYDATNTIISASPIIEKKTAGIYSLLIHDDNDCPLITSVGISSTDGAQAIVKEINPPSCSYSSDGSALIEVISGDGPFRFLWPNQQTTIVGTNLEKGTYVVSIRDANDCLVAQEVDIPAPEELDISLVEFTEPNCFGECDGKIKVSGTGGTGFHAFNWNDQSGEEALNLCAGIHAVTMVDAHGCIKQETFQLDQPKAMEVQLIDRQLPLCYGGCDGLLKIEASGGNGNYQYEWDLSTNTTTAINLCAGNHTVNVTDLKNCQVERTFSLGEPDQLHARLVKKQNPACHDGCDGQLEVQAFGGVSNYRYNWTTHETTPLLDNLCAGDYQVTIGDGNNCSVSQQYSIGNPPALTLNLGGSMTLCVGQSHTLNAGAQWASYSWKSNTGVTATSSQITVHDPGLYWLEVISHLGCIASDTFLLETSLDLLQASFLMPKQALVEDTVAIIDVSWPMPDHAEWTLPIAMEKIHDVGDVIFGQFAEPGIYEIGLTTFLGQCTDQIRKTIAILKKGEGEPEGGRIGNRESVKEFTVYPNPNDGNFAVSVEFAEEGPVSLSIWNAPTGYRIFQVHENGKKNYGWQIDLRPLSSGTYVIRLVHPKGKKYLRFLIK